MPRLVVDASIAVMWFLPEATTPAAKRILASRCELHAPDLIFAEVGNVLRKRVNGRHMALEEAEAVLAAIKASRLVIHASGGVVEAAVREAVALRQTVYDTLYLALARRLGARLVTADRRFHKALLAAGHDADVIWVTRFDEDTRP